MEDKRDYYKDALLGVAVGDAVGVPYEFKDRNVIAGKPATDMIGYGTYGLPAGTWSDDTSLTLCLADALAGNFTLQRLAANFVDWRYRNLWTARGEVFDVGIASQQAIDRLAQGTRPDLAGGFDESSNGNGSLMRILPLLFYIKDLPVSERFEWTKKVSSLTHGHIRSVIGCFYYLEFARCLINGDDKLAAYQNTSKMVADFLQSTTIVKDEINIYNRLFTTDIALQPEDKIWSSGYVLHTLEASIWCLMTTDNYRDAVLKAVNLGSDTDTTAAVTGGLAVLLYGSQNIPADWLLKLARYSDIVALAAKLQLTLEKKK